MAKFWPLHHYNQFMGENRRKTLSTASGKGGMSVTKVLVLADFWSPSEMSGPGVTV